MSIAMWKCHAWPWDVSSIGQSRFICQVLCTGIQGIYALVLGGPLATVGSSAKFCVLVFKAFLLWYWGVHWPKWVYLPSFVYWYSRHFCSGTGGGPLAKVGLSAKFCVLVFKAFLLWYWGVHWQKKVHLPNLNSQTFRCAHHRGLFALHKTNKKSKINSILSCWHAIYMILQPCLSCVSTLTTREF